MQLRLLAHWRARLCTAAVLLLASLIVAAEPVLLFHPNQEQKFSPKLKHLQPKDASWSTIMDTKRSLRQKRDGGTAEKAAIDYSIILDEKRVPPSNSFCFVSHGCWGGHVKKTQKEVAVLMTKVVDRFDAQFVIAAGDNFYKRGVTSVNDPRFEETFESVYSAPVPFITALGNHDYRLNWWAQVNYTQRSSRWHMPYPYFADYFPAASLAVVTLDCPLLERCARNRKGSRRCWDDNYQSETFLPQALEEADRQQIRWKVVVCHYPLYANGPHDNQDWLVAMMDKAFSKYNVQLYINADNHYMQVSKKQQQQQQDGSTTTGTSATTTTYYVNSGGGGGYSAHKRSDKGYRKNEHDIFEVMNNGVFVHCVTEGGKTLYNAAYTVKDGGTRVFEWSQKFVEAPPAADGVEKSSSGKTKANGDEDLVIQSKEDRSKDDDYSRTKEQLEALLRAEAKERGSPAPTDVVDVTIGKGLKRNTVGSLVDQQQQQLIVSQHRQPVIVMVMLAMMVLVLLGTFARNRLGGGGGAGGGGNVVPSVSLSKRAA